MADYNWVCGYCEYDNEPDKAGQVKVTILHWTCTFTDKDFSANMYGTVNASEQNRVYPLPALEAVPSHVMVKWVHDAMDAEELTNIENGLQADVYEQENPTSGGFTPDTEEAEVLPT